MNKIDDHYLESAIVNQDNLVVGYIPSQAELENCRKQLKVDIDYIKDHLKEFQHTNS